MPSKKRNQRSVSIRDEIWKPFTACVMASYGNTRKIHTVLEGLVEEYLHKNCQDRFSD